MIQYFLPLVNTTLLVAILVYLAAHAKGWSGPSQEARIKRLEKFEENTLVRLTRIEENYLGLGREIDNSIGKLSGEIREFRKEMYEVRRSLDRFGVRGCGYEGCPRVVGEGK